MKFFKKTKIIFITLLILFLSFSPVRAGIDEDIIDLNKKIDANKEKLVDLQKQIEIYKKNIEIKQNEVVNLINQVALLDNQITKTELEIEEYNLTIEKLGLEIDQENIKIAEKEKKINNQKDILAEFIRQIHEYDQKSYFEVLLVNTSFSEFYNQVQYLEDIQGDLHSVLEQVMDMKRELEVEKSELENKVQEVAKLKINLENEKTKLVDKKESKELLIKQTQDSEVKFQNLLYQVRYEQNNIDQDIFAIENQIRERLNLKRLQDPNFQINPGKLMWPVPNQGVAAYFHDPEYPFRFLVGEHSGVDIRTLINDVPSNGLPVRAAASGIIIKVINNGRYTGNAVYISHGDLMTIYLHLSRIDVKVDNFVVIGQQIGLTGGMPGTYGAGLSTGPHLHFEVRLKGIPVNPCDYLDPSC